MVKDIVLCHQPAGLAAQVAAYGPGVRRRPPAAARRLPPAGGNRDSEPESVPGRRAGPPQTRLRLPQCRPGSGHELPGHRTWIVIDGLLV